jgi:hypothetical protein
MLGHVVNQLVENVDQNLGDVEDASRAWPVATVRVMRDMQHAASKHRQGPALDKVFEALFSRAFSPGKWPPTRHLCRLRKSP